MDLLKLGALDADDLSVISAHMQDALVRVGDIKYLASAQQFALLANRFNWSGAEDKGKDYTRRRTGLHFNTVKSVRSSKISNGTTTKHWIATPSIGSIPISNPSAMINPVTDIW